MKSIPQPLSAVEKFLSEISLHSHGYQEITFCYLAIRKNSQSTLRQCRVFLHSNLAKFHCGHFESDSIIAGACRIKEIGFTPEILINQILNGEIKLPDFALTVPLSSHPNISYASSHPDMDRQSKSHVLNILLDRPQLDVSHFDLDWELKSADTPYESLPELLRDYQLGALNQHSVLIEFIAPPAVMIHAPGSSTSQGKATITIDLSANLSPQAASIGLRVLAPDNSVSRRTIPGSLIKWTSDADFQRGLVDTDVERGAIIQCIAKYRGKAHHYWWISDPLFTNNPLRAAYSTFDPNLVVLEDFLKEPQTKNFKGRDLEFAISWLLWMLGFRVAHLGATPRTQEAIDIIAVTPFGSIAVIECTHGLLRSDNKLPLLVERHEKIRKALETSNNQHVKSLPVIVTSKPRREIKADLEQAKKLGVVVVTREDLEEGLRRTNLIANPNEIFEEAERSLLED